MDKILVTVIKNPFDPHGSLVRKYADYVPNKSVEAYLTEFYPMVCPDVEVQASRNGALIDDTSEVPAPNDSLVLCPVFRGGGGGGDKNPLATIAQLAVVVVAAVVTYGASTWATAAGYGAAAAAGIGAAAGGVTMMAGGLLVNAIFPSSGPKALSAGDMSEDSPTYSWGRGANPYEEGNAVPVLFGRMRITPTIISSYTRSVDDKQFLSVLYMLAEGVVDDISGVRINENMFTNYDEVKIEKRYGANDQEPVSFFGDTYADKNVGAKINEDLSWTTTTTPGDSADGIVVVLSCPSGLWYASDDGGLSKVSVSVDIEARRQDGTTWGNWENWGTYQISGSDYSTIRKTMRKDNLQHGKYEIRCKFSKTPPSGSRYGADTYLDYIQEVFYDDFSYPNTALLGVEALATDQLSGGMPRTDCVVDRKYVSVNGVNKPASNPAWACWSILSDEISGLGIPEKKLIYDEFLEWAEWCNEKGIYCGLYVDSTMSAPSAISLLSQLGRGSVIQRGNSYGVIVDKPSLPVQMFTVGNIVADSFEETWLSLEDRTNVISVEYWDEKDDFVRKTFQVRDEPFNSDKNDIEATITLTGCTNKDVAFRHARYMLNCNKFLLRTVSITAEIDAIACQPGDVILIQHDVPEWGYGGRIQGYNARTGEITLDRKVNLSLSSGSYRIAIRHTVDDGIEEKTITQGAGETDTVNAGVIWDHLPEAGDLYSVGQVGIVTKPFRIVSISKTSDMACKITCLEYFDEIYEDAGNVPDVTQYSGLAFTANLKGVTTVRELEGLQKKVLCLSWSGSALQWSVFKRLLGQGAPWEFLGTTSSPRYDVFNLQDNRYYELCVSHTGDPSGGETVIVNFPGDATPAGLEIVYENDGVTPVTTLTGDTVYVIGD